MGVGWGDGGTLGSLGTYGGGGWGVSWGGGSVGGVCVGSWVVLGTCLCHVDGGLTSGEQ